MLHREKVKCYLTSDYSLFLDLLRKVFSIITCAVNFLLSISSHPACADTTCMHGVYVHRIFNYSGTILTDTIGTQLSVLYREVSLIQW